MNPNDLAEHLLSPLRSRMAQEFDDLDKFALHLVTLEVALKAQNRESLKQIGKVLTEDMKNQIGTYQPAVGNYLPWADLAESTLAAKERESVSPLPGMDGDMALYFHGGLRNSFRSDVRGSEELVAGSTDPTMEYHEFGTSKMPPRSVVGPALLKHIPEIQALLGAGVVSAICVGQRLGYRFSETGGIGELNV